MSAKKVSRTPYRVRRDPREVATAVVVAVVIVLLTALAVWILAPAGDPPTTPVPVPPSAPAGTTPPTTGVPSTGG
jgi:hypothetical protein